MSRRRAAPGPSLAAICAVPAPDRRRVYRSTGALEPAGVTVRAVQAVTFQVYTLVRSGRRTQSLLDCQLSRSPGARTVTLAAGNLNRDRDYGPRQPGPVIPS